MPFYSPYFNNMPIGTSSLKQQNPLQENPRFIEKPIEKQEEKEKTEIKDSYEEKAKEMVLKALEGLEKKEKNEKKEKKIEKESNVNEEKEIKFLQIEAGSHNQNSVFLLKE